MVLAWAKETGTEMDRVNRYGGAIAVGHPSGVRLAANLLRALEETAGRRWLQVMCESGGIANAALLERLS